MSHPEHPGPGDDELFEQIVAGFGEEPADPVPRWPVSEDISEPRQTRWTGAPRRRDDPTPSPEPPPEPPPVPPPVPEVEALPGWLEPEALEDDGHYEPPPPPKVPLPRLRTVLAWVALLLGLGVLFAPLQLGVSDTGEWKLLGLALTAGGAALLLSGMRDAPPTDSGPDDGAVV